MASLRLPEPAWVDMSPWKRFTACVVVDALRMMHPPLVLPGLSTLAATAAVSATACVVYHTLGNGVLAAAALAAAAVMPITWWVPIATLCWVFDLVYNGKEPGEPRPVRSTPRPRRGLAEETFPVDCFLLDICVHIAHAILFTIFILGGPETQPPSLLEHTVLLLFLFDEIPDILLPGTCTPPAVASPRAFPGQMQAASSHYAAICASDAAAAAGHRGGFGSDDPLGSPRDWLSRVPSPARVSMPPYKTADFSAACKSARLFRQHRLQSPLWIGLAGRLG